MNWWYRNIFVDRNMSLTNVKQATKQPEELKLMRNLLRYIRCGLSWLAAKYQEKAQFRHDWKVYKNLSDHQLEDIGLTRDDLYSLLHNKKPVIRQQRVKPVRKPKLFSSEVLLLRDSDLEKPLEISGHGVCSNDCGDKVA